MKIFACKHLKPSLFFQSCLWEILFLGCAKLPHRIPCSSFCFSWMIALYFSLFFNSYVSSLFMSISKGLASLPARLGGWFFLALIELESWNHQQSVLLASSENSQSFNLLNQTSLNFHYSKGSFPLFASKSIFQAN